MHRQTKAPSANIGRYIPALKYSWLTSLYDPLLKWVMHEATFKQHLVKQARIEKGHRILDLGCGTATLTILIKRMHPEAEVVGLDGDPIILEIARAKAAKAGVKIKLEQGMAFELPYPDGSFDRVLASLVFHHLTRENKIRTLRDVFRVLGPGGELHVVDFGKPDSALMYLISITVRRFEETVENIEGLLPDMLQDASFIEIEETARYRTVFGTLSALKAKKPDSC